MTEDFCGRHGDVLLIAGKLQHGKDVSCYPSSSHAMDDVVEAVTWRDD